MIKRKSIAFFLFLFIVSFEVLRGNTQEYNIYWGDLHGHTTISDGNVSVDEFLTYARDTAKLDFVVVTDHDFGNAPPWRMPTTDWKSIQNKVDAYTVNGKFIAIAGYEWTSQPKYWKMYNNDTLSGGLFKGFVKGYNHKNVYFPKKVDNIFCANDEAFNSPNLLAQAVLKVGGIIHNNHPSVAVDGKDQWDYDSAYYSVIVNTEIRANTIYYSGKEYQLNWEQLVRNFLDEGGKTGFIGSTDSHDGKPAARTAVLAKELTRDAIFEALRHRLNYAVSNAKIIIDFKVNKHNMGEEIVIKGKPQIKVYVKGTDKIKELSIIRDGCIINSISPGKHKITYRYVDNNFNGKSYYYLRVIQEDKDEHGNFTTAWSSPIWVKLR